MAVETNAHKNIESSSSDSNTNIATPTKNTASSSTRDNYDYDEYSSNKNHRGSTRQAALSAAISWLESLRVPKALEPRTKISDRFPGDINDNGSEKSGIPVISGLDRVCFGTQPVCEAVSVCGFHPPRYLCYMVSGFVCDVIQFGIDIILHKVFLLEDASVCWALGFGLSVSFRHSTHRYLVFGDYVGGYWASLGRMYAGYSIIIVISTLFNIVMTRHMQLPHYVAWVVTLLWTGIVNYFILKKLWNFGEKGKKDDETMRTDEGSLSEGDEMMPSPQKDLEMQDRQKTSRLQSRKTDTSKR